MNVSAGDLAYIVTGGCGASVADTGKPVKAESYYGMVLTTDGNLACWKCTSGLELHTFRGTIIPPGKIILIPDLLLRRIAGPSIDTTETTEKPIKEPA